MRRLVARLVEPSHGRRRPSRVRDPADRRRRMREEDPFAAPGAAQPVRRGARENDGRAAGGFDPLQLPFGEEADGTAVGRPEREVGVVRSGKLPGRELVERPHPESPRSPRPARHESQVRSVGRDREEIQEALLGKKDRRPDRAGGFRRAAEIAGGEEPGQDRADGETRPGDPLAALPPGDDGAGTPACEPPSATHFSPASHRAPSASGPPGPWRGTS